MREKENYRGNLELILEHFGDVSLLPRRKVAAFLGVDERTVAKSFPQKKMAGRYFVTAVDLAKWLS